MGRRTILLVAAVLVAALGTTLVFLYARGADQRAAAGQELVKVLFAKSEIAVGTTGTAAAQSGALEQREVTKNSVAEGALSDISPVANQVTLAPIFPGEQILQQQFGAPGSQSALPIPAGKVAVSVQLGDPERVAGFVTSGSHVAVFATVATAAGTTAAGQGNLTQVLLPDVLVVGVGSSTLVTTTTTTASGQQNSEQISRAILTLALDQTEATKIIYATQQGQLYFALLTADSKVSPGGGVTSANLFK
jgi:pilus assembly protein CpaB